MFREFRKILIKVSETKQKVSEDLNLFLGIILIVSENSWKLSGKYGSETQ